jgi:hypothetical protein
LLNARTFWFALWTAIVVVRGFGLVARYINHDAAWYLYMARVLLNGGSLYRDVVDTNPPLIVWLLMPPAGVAQLFGAAETLMFVLYVTAAVIISLVACWYLLGRVWPEFPVHLRLGLVTLLLFLMFVRIHTAFGQREHFTMLLSLPYVLAAMAWIQGRPLERRAGIAVGVAAGVGLALKPHWLLPALLIEYYLAVFDRVRRPWRRAEAIAVTVTVVAYGVALVILVPAFFDVVLRAGRVYHGLNPPAINLLRVPEVPLWGLTALLLWLIRIPARSRQPWIVLCLAGTGFLIAGLSQMKGWEDHMYPARVVLTFLLCAQLFWVLHAISDLAATIRGGTRTVAVVVAMALLVMTTRRTIADRQPDTHDLVTPLRASVERHAKRGPIFVMGMLLYPAFPLVNVAHVDWSSRYNSFWFLPGLYFDQLDAAGEFRFRIPSEMPALEHAFFDEVIADLCARPPAVLIVESVTQEGAGGRRPFDLVSYYSQDARFQHLFAAYEPVDRVGAFSVLVPRTPPSCATGVRS